MTSPDFSLIIYGLPEPVLLVEPKGTVVGANPGASRLFRRPSPEIVGEPLTALVADDPETLTGYLRQCSRNSAGHPGGLNIQPSNGQPILCKAMGGLVHNCEEQPRLVWLRLLPRNRASTSFAEYDERQTLARETRAGQRNEQRWRTAFESSAIGIIMADFAGRFLAANRAFRNMLGYTESELYTLTFVDLTYEDDREANLELVRELVEGKRQHFQMEKRYRRKDGTLLWVRTNVALVPGMDGVAPFWFAIVENITERKSIEEELRLQMEVLQTTKVELARVSRLTTMGELAASIAHEINQPLTAITNNSNACLRLLADHNLEPEALRRALEEIVADGTRANAVMAGIRAFIMKAPAEKKELDINEVIQEVLALTGRELDENRVLLERQLTKHLPLVLGDRLQLQEVLLNLIVNGIEAMTAVANRPRLLWVESRIDESRNVVIAVRDSGTGLGLEADRIFTPFFTTKANGMGMGLSISRSLVEGHGGRLWATPNSPHGAVVCFTLPARTSSSISMAAVAAGSPS